MLRILLPAEVLDSNNNGLVVLRITDLSPSFWVVVRAYNGSPLRAITVVKTIEAEV